MAVAIPLIALAGTAVGGYMQYQSSRSAASTASSVANYNANLDIEQAKQNDIDSQANIDRQRAANKVYLSRQRTAIAAAGVLDSGTPLDLMAETSSRMETDIQDKWRETNLTDEKLYSAARAGIAEGDASARAYRMQGTASLFDTVGKLGSMGYQDYQSGAFKNG